MRISDWSSDVCSSDLNVRVDNGNIIDSGVIADADTAFYAGAEAAAVLGPLTVAGEYGRLSIDRLGSAPSADVDGFYVFATYFLTGESRPFNNGNSDRVKPLANFSQAGLGARGSGERRVGKE